MNFFWGRVFEYWKERRLAFIFVSTLMLFFGAIGLGRLCYLALDSFGWLRHLPLVLAGIGLVFAALIGRAVYESRRRRADRYKSSLLSRDELSKARSKLRTKSTFKKI
jgi:hypothetical protein